MKIVIADDSELLRNRIKDSLKEIKEIEIIGEAGNGIEAIKIIKEKKPDFIFLDIRMPEMNGIEVLKKMKENNINSKVCILTNYPYPQYKVKCLEEGADYFLDKTNEFEKIVEICSSFLVNYQS